MGKNNELPIGKGRFPLNCGHYVRHWDSRVYIYRLVPVRDANGKKRLLLCRQNLVNVGSGAKTMCYECSKKKEEVRNGGRK